MLVRFAGAALILSALSTQAARADSWMRITCDYTEETGAFQLPEQFNFNMTKMTVNTGGDTLGSLKATAATLEWGDLGAHYTLNRKTLWLRYEQGFSAQCRLAKPS